MKLIKQINQIISLLFLCVIIAINIKICSADDIKNEPVIIPIGYNFVNLSFTIFSSSVFPTDNIAFINNLNAYVGAVNGNYSLLSTGNFYDVFRGKTQVAINKNIMYIVYMPQNSYILYECNITSNQCNYSNLPFTNYMGNLTSYNNDLYYQGLNNVLYKIHDNKLYTMDLPNNINTIAFAFNKEGKMLVFGKGTNDINQPVYKILINNSDNTWSTLSTVPLAISDLNVNGANMAYNAKFDELYAYSCEQDDNNASKLWCNVKKYTNNTWQNVNIGYIAKNNIITNMQLSDYNNLYLQFYNITDIDSSTQSIVYIPQ